MICNLRACSWSTPLLRGCEKAFMSVRAYPLGLLLLALLRSLLACSSPLRLAVGMRLGP